MTVGVAVNQRFLATSQAQSARDWDQLLAHQVDLLLADELPLLAGFPAWREARRVLDAGCGNGYYLSRVAAFFPEKEFVGIDISNELIVAARQAHPDHAFIAGDFFTADIEPADVVLMRFLVQHLRDFRAVLRGAARALKPGGTLVIIESDMSRSEIRPLPGAFHRMLLAYHEASASEGGLKAELLADVRKLICETNEPWGVVAEYEAHTSRVGPFDDGKLVRVFLKWVDLAERSGMFAFDFGSVRAELDDWWRNPAAFVSLATRMFFLQPRPLV